MITWDIGIARTVFLKVGVENGSTGTDGAGSEELLEMVDADSHGGSYGIGWIEVFGWAHGGCGDVLIDHGYEFIAVGVGVFEAAIFYDQTHVLTKTYVNERCCFGGERGTCKFGGG